MTTVMVAVLYPLSFNSSIHLIVRQLQGTNICVCSKESLDSHSDLAKARNSYLVAFY